MVFGYLKLFSLCVYNDDRLIYKSGDLWTHRYEDLYYNTFIDGFTYRDSCFNCHYAKPERVSDITIGDFGDWVMKLTIIIFPNIRMAFPVFFLLQKKGKRLISIVKDKLNIYERPVTEAINGNDQLRFPKKKNLRIKFLEESINT